MGFKLKKAFKGIKLKTVLKAVAAPPLAVAKASLAAAAKSKLAPAIASVAALVPHPAARALAGALGTASRFAKAGMIYQQEPSYMGQPDPMEMVETGGGINMSMPSSIAGAPGVAPGQRFRELRLAVMKARKSGVPLGALGRRQPRGMAPSRGAGLVGAAQQFMSGLAGAPVGGMGYGYRRRRGRGISARDMRTTRRTMRSIVKLYHSLPKGRSRGSYRSYGFRKRRYY